MQQIDQSDLLQRKFHYIFADKKFKGMKKKIFAILVMASLAFNVCSATLGSINYFTVSVDGSDMSFPTQPSGRGPAQNEYDIYAVYNSAYDTLYISFQENPSMSYLSMSNIHTSSPLSLLGCHSIL